ncbi:MAG: hypothetical protein NTW87_29205 [Planctomycetota bacterium]|nr:hypothetical protein [Planctomycetota bacterium]
MSRTPISLLWPLLAMSSLSLSQAAELPPLQLAGVRPDKILYDEKAPVRGEVTVKNNAKDAKTVTVRAWLAWELDQTTPVQETQVTVPGGQTATAAFDWPQAPGKFGHALKAEVRLDAAVACRGEDCFSVCNDYWNVALIAAVGFLWQQFDNFKPKPDLKWADETVASFRREYHNGFEKFFWAPDDFLEMTPEQEIWWSGQARYLETKAGLKGLIAKAHAQGMKVVTYAKLTGGGPTGAEMARRHPEWMWQSGGTLAVDRNAEHLAEWDVTGAKHWGGWVAVNYNMNDAKVVDIGIKELIDTAAMFGWDGARWDGNFDVAREVYDLDGKPVEKLTAEEADTRNADNMRRTKAAISKAYPRYVYGYNWCQSYWDQTMATNPKESTELCRGGGLIMNEYINQADGVQHPLHRWDVYGPSVANDVEAIKKLGGYYGPILGSPDTADGRYTNVFAYAAGAHPYYHHLWGAFMTRFGGFCWDNALTRVKDAEKIVAASDKVWWKNWVFERPADATHKQLIIHLINPPAKPTVGEGKKKEDLPAPVKDVAVKLLPGALTEWKVVRATRLSPEPALQETVPVTMADGACTLTVPEVAIWNILVVDCEKKEGR